MKLLLSTPFLLLSFQYFAQKTDTVYSEEDYSVEIINYNQNNQLDGKYIQYTDDDFDYPLIEGEYKDGVRNGKWMEYIYYVEVKEYPGVTDGITKIPTTDYSSIIRNTWHYKNGKKENSFTSETGGFLIYKFKVDNSLCFGQYSNDKPVGKWILQNVVDSPRKWGEYIGWLEFDDNGNKIGEWKISEGSANHGLVLPIDTLLNNYPIKVVLDDGSYGIGYFHNGIKTGKWKYYSEAGELKKEEEYNSGKLVEEKRISLTKVIFNNNNLKHIDFVDYFEKLHWLLLAQGNYDGTLKFWLYDIKDTLNPIFIKNATYKLNDVYICDVGFKDSLDNNIYIKNCKEADSKGLKINLITDELTILDHYIDFIGTDYEDSYLNNLGIPSKEYLNGEWMNFEKVSQFHNLLKVSQSDQDENVSVLLNLATGEIKNVDSEISIGEIAKKDLGITTFDSIQQNACFDKNFSGAYNCYYRGESAYYYNEFKKDIPELDPIGFIYIIGEPISEKKHFYYVNKNLASFRDKRDGKNLVFFWNCDQKDQNRWVNLNMKPSGDYILYTPDNYYLASKSLKDQIYFEKDMITYPLEQFDLKYNRPDIILDRLGYADSSLITAYHQAYLKRLKKMGFKEEMLENDFHLPGIKIENIEEMPNLNNDGSINLNLNMHDSKYNLDRINVWVNDVAIYGTNGISIRDKDVKDYKTNLQIFLAKGRNKVQVSVLNIAGVESYKQTFEIECTSGKEKPDLYLITIGASKFKQSGYNLTYASKDAQDLSSLLSNSKEYEKVHSKILTNDLVTKENVLALKSYLEKADINDHVIIFFAGHGVLSNDLDYYLATYDMDFNTPEKRGLAYDDLEKLLDGIKPLKKTLIIDACHSGEIDKEDVKLASVENTFEGDVQFRAVGKSVQSKLGAQNTLELTKSLFTDFRKGTGATVISSAGGMEFAMESGEWKNGLFTYALLNGIETGEADLNKDDEIWLSELQEYVSETVSRLSNGKQQPTSRIENQIVDFRVW